MTKLQEAKEICTRVLLIPFEGYHERLPNGDCRSYPDPATKNDPVKQGKPITIGYGSTRHIDGRLIELGEVWTHDQALVSKKHEVATKLSVIISMSPNIVQATPNRIAAVLSWVYNCGLGNYRISTFKRMIDQGRWTEAAEQCLRWNRANGKVMRGLTRRRQAEAVMLRSG